MVLTLSSSWALADQHEYLQSHEATNTKPEKKWEEYDQFFQQQHSLEVIGKLQREFHCLLQCL